MCQVPDTASAHVGPQRALSWLLCGHHWASDREDTGEPSVPEGGHPVSASVRLEGAPWPRTAPWAAVLVGYLAVATCGSCGSQGSSLGPRAALPLQREHHSPVRREIHTPGVQSRRGAACGAASISPCLSPLDVTLSWFASPSSCADSDANVSERTTELGCSQKRGPAPGPVGVQRVAQGGALLSPNRALLIVQREGWVGARWHPHTVGGCPVCGLSWVGRRACPVSSDGSRATQPRRHARGAVGVSFRAEGFVRPVLLVGEAGAVQPQGSPFSGGGAVPPPVKQDSDVLEAGSLRRLCEAAVARPELTSSPQLLPEPPSAHRLRPHYPHPTVRETEAERSTRQ